MPGSSNIAEGAVKPIIKSIGTGFLALAGMYSTTWIDGPLASLVR